MRARSDTSGSSAASPGRAGAFAAGGALLSAIGSSACCWLPLLLLALGTSATGLSAWFERYRLVFLISAGVLLAFAFYSVYFRAGRCEPGSACSTGGPSSRWLTKAMLWVSAAGIVGFAAFPKYAGPMLTDNRLDALPAPSTVGSVPSVTYRIQGMTCEACAVTLQRQLRGVDGVADVSVSYTDRSATVIFEGGKPVVGNMVVDAAKQLGYTASASDLESPKKP